MGSSLSRTPALRNACAVAAYTFAWQTMTPASGASSSDTLNQARNDVGQGARVPPATPC